MNHINCNVPLKFTVWDGTTAKTPSAATVIITKPGDEQTTSVAATITTNTVSYVVPTSVTAVTGKYEAIFTLTIDGNIRKHKINFEVES